MQHKNLSLVILSFFLCFPSIVLCKRVIRNAAPTVDTKEQHETAQCDAQAATKSEEQQTVQSVVEQPKEYVHQVRVLLAEQSASGDALCNWVLESTAGFYLADPATGANRMQSKCQKLLISCKDCLFFINNKQVTQKEFVFKPKDGHLVFQNIAYEGSFLITVDEKQKRCYLINVLDLEDYVCSVLKSEGWPGWPLEMNKVLAITSRTYVLAMMKEAREGKRRYDVKNTNAHQTYRGAHAEQILKRAVNDTKGLFVSYQNSPIVAMFDICCGGVVPAYIQGFDFVRAPYLARSYACKHCQDCKSFNWSFSLSKDDLMKHLQKEYPQLVMLRELKITKKDKAGLVLEAHAKGARASVAITGKKLYSTFKKIKSYCFAISKKGSTITFSGRGFGHHIGLCQWGARAMVRDGWGYCSVLSFYYPMTKLMKLT